MDIEKMPCLSKCDLSFYMFGNLPRLLVFLWTMDFCPPRKGFDLKIHCQGKYTENMGRNQPFSITCEIFANMIFPSKDEK